jgi:hypothetical protein
MLSLITRTKICLILGILAASSLLLGKDTFAQASNDEILSIMKLIVDAENEVRQTGDLESVLIKLKTLDDSEKAVLRKELLEIKQQKNFLRSRVKGKELLKDFKTSLLDIVDKQQKDNKILIDIKSKDEAAIDDPELQAQKFNQYSEAKTLRFEFNVINGKPKLASKKWIDPPESFKYDTFSKITPTTAPANIDEYLDSLSTESKRKGARIQLPSSSSIMPFKTLISFNFEKMLSQNIFSTIPLVLISSPDLVAQSAVLNRSAMKNYIITWVYSRNSAYRSYDNDCTNFASQILEAGGWKRVGDQSKDPKDSQWWYTTSPSNLIPPNQSESWTVAPVNYQFINRSGRATPVNSVSQLNTGDIIHLDFGNGNGIYHTMIVTTKSSTGEILVSYHTNDTYLKPISQLIAAYPQGKFYTWKLKDSY